MRNVSAELRKPNGEWTASPNAINSARQALIALRGGNTSVSTAEAKAMAERIHAQDPRDTVARAAARSRGRSAVLTSVKPEYIPSPREIQDQASRSDPGMNREAVQGHPEAKPSMSLQLQAQATAAAVMLHAQDGASPFLDEPTASAKLRRAGKFWQDYQEPNKYGIINATLRGPDSPKRKTLLNTADTMFNEMGYTLPTPMTLFRAIKAGGPSGTDWKKTLVPGADFQDNGMISATASPNFAEGWLDLPSGSKVGTSLEASQGRIERSDDVIMEIRVPKGTRVVGGDPQFIETMLKPGTKFHIVSQEQRKSKNAINPITEAKSTFTYTHVIAEVIQ